MNEQLSGSLLAILEQGFCGDSLRQLANTCVLHCRQGSSGTEPSRLLLPFVLSRVCYRVEDLLEDDPTVAKHDRFEAALRPAMLEAISLVDTGPPSEVMVAADRLIAAYFTLIPSTLALKLH